MSHYTLYYVHDPMCSWCWAFRPVWERVKQQLPDSVSVQYLLGGLAPDSSEPMPESMQQSLQQTWARIQQVVPGTRFNFAFWQSCRPRRSTWPACRAVIAARNQVRELEQAMILGIQKAYYLEAKNPSDETTLASIAAALGLDAGRLLEDMQRRETQLQLEHEITQHLALPSHGFPSLILESAKNKHFIQHDYNSSDATLASIDRLLQ